MNDDDLVKLQVTNGVATITLNRPSKRNALDQSLIQSLKQALESLNSSEEAKAIILTGAGEAFCAGGDLSLLQAMQKETVVVRAAMYREVQKIILELEALQKPVIAAVNGAAVGAGLDLALACDVIFAGQSASFGEVFSSVGLVTDMGGSYNLQRLIGIQRAKELIFSSRILNVAEAYEWGLVNRVVPDQQLLAQTQNWAEKLIKDVSLVAVGRAKILINEARNIGLRQALDREADTQAMLMDTREHQAKVAAFLRK